MRFVFLSSLSFFPSFFLSFLFPFFPSFLSSSMYSFSFSIHYSLRQILLRPLINPNANTQLVEFSRGSSSFPDRKVTWILFGQHGNVRESSSIGSRPSTKVRSLFLSFSIADADADGDASGANVQSIANIRVIDTYPACNKRWRQQDTKAPLRIKRVRLKG